MRRRDLVALLGAAITWPAGARGQQSIPEIGFLSTGSSESDDNLLKLDYVFTPASSRHRACPRRSKRAE